jgi:hypothetical protein
MEKTLHVFQARRWKEPENSEAALNLQQGTLGSIARGETLCFE